MDIAARTGALFAAFEANDAESVAALCAPGCRVKQNNDPDVDLDTLLVQLRAMLWDAGVTTAYSDIRRTVAEGVVTEQHLVTLTRPDGVQALCDACVVVRFDDDGLITRVDEYLDMAAFAPLFS